MGNCRSILVLCCHIFGRKELDPTAQANNIRKDLLGQKDLLINGSSLG